MEPTERAEQRLEPDLTQQALAETQAEPYADLEDQRHDSESFQDQYPASDADSAVGSVSNVVCVTSLVPMINTLRT